MANNKNCDRVEIFIPRGNMKDDPNLLVGINGVNYILPKGKTSKVPAFVAAEIERSMKAEASLNATIDSLLAESK